MFPNSFPGTDIETLIKIRVSSIVKVSLGFEKVPFHSILMISCGGVRMEVEFILSCTEYVVFKTVVNDTIDIDGCGRLILYFVTKSLSDV